MNNVIAEDDNLIGALTGDALAASSAEESDEMTGISCEQSEKKQNGIVIGVLIGFKNGGRTPLVIYPGQRGSAALPARTIRDVHGAHIGRQVVLVFENADAHRPIVVGCLQPQEGWPAEQAGQVEVDADGERLIVSAKEQLVLRCGDASITLTKSGKVLIRGAYVSSRSSGVNRIKGGAVQIN